MKVVHQSDFPPATVSRREDLRVLLVEDSEADAVLLLRHLNANGFKTQHLRVASEMEMEKALQDHPWDIILCDYQMPGFGVSVALDLLKQKGLDVPLIVVSGAIGEELAVELMRSGAHDFIVKGRLGRLIPAIERELREAQARRERALALQNLCYLAAIVDSAEEAIMAQNMEGIITTWNAGAARLYGYSAAETLGQPASLIVPTSLHQASAIQLEKLRRNETVEPMETTRQRKDGAPIQVGVTLSAIRDGNGCVIGISSIEYDITERKRAEAERNELIAHLNETLSKVKTLSGLLPICASCKKIRDDQGYWQKLETFVREHSQAEFSHSICPECMQSLYPEYAAGISSGDH